MNAKYFTGLVALLVLLVASGCCKKKLYCQSGKMNVIFAGFGRSESRSISIKRYKTGEHAKALDSGTLVYNKNLPALAPGQKDTLSLNDYFSSSYAFTGIKTGNDWLIYMPATRKSYLITSLGENDHHSELVRCGDNSTTCTAEVAHFSINNDWRDNNELWIVKTTD